MKYDRQLLLAGSKRNAVLALSEIHAYGRDSYGDLDYVSIYGLRPADWYAKGIRLLGRTAVECTRDDLADRIGKDAAAVTAGATSPVTPLLIDPFAGSANTLYWLAHHLSVERGIGFELDPSVFALTRANLAILGLPLDVFNSDYRAGLLTVDPAENQLVVAFIAPPWGDALSPVSGLDLRQTCPPISEITKWLSTRFGRSRILFIVQVYEALNHGSFTELTATFDWSALKLYDLNAQGQNHGVLLGTVRWKPPTQDILPGRARRLTA
jgi:hypothetical protein